MPVTLLMSDAMEISTWQVLTGISYEQLRGLDVGKPPGAGHSVDERRDAMEISTWHVLTGISYEQLRGCGGAS